MTDLESRFYELAARELAEKRTVLAVMAKAFAECNGDERRSGALYIRMRVRQLAIEHEEKQRRAERLAKEAADEKARAEAHRIEAVRKAGETKLLYYGDLCGRCDYFTPTPWRSLDSKAGRCGRYYITTYKGYSCVDFVPKK